MARDESHKVDDEADAETPLLKPSSTVGREWMLFLRGSLGVAAGILIFVGVSYLPPSQAVALYATAPFWSILFSYLISGEVLTGFVTVCMVACFGGVLFILEPWAFGSESGISDGLILLAGALSLLAGALVGIVGPLIRTMPSVHVLELVLWLGLVGVVANTTIAIFFEEHGIFDLCAWASAGIMVAPWSTVALVAILGLTSFVGQLCLNLAWQLESAPTVTMVHMYSLIAFQVVVQVLVAQVSACACACASVRVGVGVCAIKYICVHMYVYMHVCVHA
jgi:drug/metabolite transporter (DMT)-like permease